MEVSSDRPYAMITGGSKGIGYAIAKALAKRNYNLVLIGRNMDDLLIAKNKLQSECNTKVEILNYDLTDNQIANKIASWCLERNFKLTFLCNVAGIGGSQDFLSASLEQMQFMIRLNIESTMAVTMLLLPLLKANQPSYILNVSSLAGFSPLPIKNMYAATKSAVIFFSYALRYQLKKENISVSCLCPGPVYTRPDIKQETLNRLGWFGSAMAVDPEKVGEVAIKKTLQRKLIIVPGALASVMAFLLRVLPKRIVCYIYYTFGTK